jgi:hypothetical protein
MRAIEISLDVGYFSPEKVRRSASKVKGDFTTFNKERALSLTQIEPHNLSNSLRFLLKKMPKFLR